MKFEVQNIIRSAAQGNLRKWLNDEFYNTVFTAAEKEFIKTSHCTGNGEGSPDTGDKVFLLSVDEIKAVLDKNGKDLRPALKINLVL